MAKHRQTATGRKDVAAKRTKDSIAALAVPVSTLREINLVRRAGAPIVTSAVGSVASSAYPSRAASPTPRQPFRFFDLPSELRNRIYEMALHKPTPVDLDSLNYRTVLPRLSLFLVNHRMHEEAYPIFYGQPVRLFPHRDAGRFYNTKKPLLQRLPLRYREAITCMELRLGSGWSKPPACQNTWREELGLGDCVNFRTLKIFVECDPSDTIFAGFRGMNATEETYKHFCVDLLLGLIRNVPSLDTIEIDAYPPVKRDSPLVSALVRQVCDAQLRLMWGKLRGWDQDKTDLVELVGLATGMQSMSLSPATSRVVEVQA